VPVQVLSLTMIIMTRWSRSVSQNPGVQVLERAGVVVLIFRVDRHL
jgi:hypothetical protein